MNDLSDLCFLCLVHNKNIKLKENSYLQIKEEFNYFIPEHIFQNSETPKYVCDDCMKSLNKINEFRRKCLKNIAIYKEHEQKLSRDPDSHKYLTIDKINILHQNNTEINCDVHIKTEIFEADDTKIQNDVKTNETCKVTENEDKICDETNYDREVKIETCEANDFKPPTEYKTGDITNDTQIHEIFIKHEINEEFIIKEDDKQEDFSGIHNVQQEPICNQNESGNSVSNKNGFDAAVGMCTSNQELLKIFNKNDLKIHQKKSHICDVCQKSFSSANYLRFHKFVHTGDKPYVCDICQKAFRGISNLQTHKRIHSGEKPYVCDVCEKSFNRTHILKRHKLTHSGEKPYKCDVCQKLFRQISTLKAHKLMHTGEKPYTCDVCQRSFSRASILKIHKLSHTG